MKPLLFMLFFSFASSLFAQENEVFFMVEELPIFGKCDENERNTKIKNYYTQNDVNDCSTLNIQKFIAKETALLELPPRAEVKKCFVNFIINEEGHLVDAAIMKSSGDEKLDEIALGIINKMQDWKAGQQDGKAVKVSYVLPVIFK